MRNAPATFQRRLDLILSSVRFKTCLVYLNDVLIFSGKVEYYIQKVDEVFTLLENSAVSLKIRRCKFFQKFLDYLGHVLLSGQIAISKDSTSTTADANITKK